MLAAKTLCNTAVANLCVGDQVLVSARPPTRGSAAASGSAANSAASATAAASVYRRAQIVRIRVDTTTHAVDLGVAYLDEVALTKAMDLGVSAAVATRDQLAATGATTDESQLVWYPAWSVSVANAPLTVVRNCADLAHRSSFTIADALAAALRLGIIHTKIGFINVSVNPLCQVGPQDQVGPAEEAAVEILRGGDRHHTIIVTGVSGSGKTVYTFEQLEYLCRLASAGVDGDAASSSSTHEARPDASRDANPVGTALMAVVPLLERLGNARTPFNDNSSRVGNEWKLSFDTASGTLRLVGVCLATNMLESPRVAWQGKGEGNFHIFYDFVGCKEPGFLARYGLENATPDTLVFFCNGLAVSPYGSDPDAAAAGWPKFCQGWQAAGLSLGQLRFLERVIATVLHLGQARSGLVATRASRHGEEVSDFDEVGAHHMGVVEDLCGIEAGTLSSAILHPTRAFGNRDVTAINRTVAEARTAVDALASKIYALAFDWLVAILNDARLSGVGDRSNAPFAPATITIMDQPGFESLEVNNLSQLMINNANQLRAVKLNEYHVRNERMALAGDGATTTLDGVPVVIPDPGVGDTAAYDVVMSLLEAVDDQTKVGRRDAASADATCLDAFFDRLGSQAVGRHGRPAIERVPGTTTSFEVGHFASTVRYTADGMVSMNDGRLERSVLGAVVDATNLSDIRAGIDADGARPTVAQQYKTDLQKHENTIDASKAHFVWCFRPSATQEPGEVDRGYLVRQLDNNGCTRHLEVADAGFPHRIPLRTLHKWLSFVLVPRLVPADARPTFTLPRIQSVIRAEVEAGLLSVIDALHQQESDANDALDGVSNGVSRSSLTPAAVALGNGNAYFKTHAFTALERFSRAVWTRKAQVMGLAVARKLRAIRASESYRVAERRRVEELESRQLNEIAALETRLTTLSSALESAVGDKSAIEAEKAAVVAALREAEALAAREREQRAALEHARVELEASLAEHRANQDALAQALAETKSEAERARLEAALQREALLAQREARAVEERRAREAAAQAVTLEAAVCDLEAREAAAQREARRIHDEKAAVEAERDALVRDVAKLKEAPRPGAWRTKVAAAVEVFKTALRDTLVSVSNDPDWIEHVHTETTNAYRALDRRWFTNYGARDCIPLMWEMTVQAVSEGLVANTLARLADSPDFDVAVAEVIVALLAEQIAKPARFGAEYDACLCTGRGRLRSAMQAFVKSEGTEALKAVVFAGDDPHGVYDVLYERSGSVFKYFSNYGRAKEAIKVTLSSTLATVAMGGGEMMSAALAEKLELVLVRKAGALVSDYVYRHAQWADDDAYADAVSDLEALPSAGSCLAADPAAGVGFVDAQPFGGVGGSSSGSSGEETAKIEMDAIGCLTGVETSVVDHKEIARGVEIGRASVFHPRSVAGAEVGV